MSKKRKEPRKKNRDWQKTLSRVLIIVILFACVIGFSLSTSFFSIFQKAEAGDYVIVDYTLYYEEGFPIISSDSYMVKDAYEKGLPVAYTNPLVLQVGSLQDEQTIPVDAYNYHLGNTRYALLDLELDTISSEVEGMSVNDIKKVELEFAPTLKYKMDAEEFKNIENLNFSDTKVGMMLFRKVFLNETAQLGNQSDIYRPSVIVEKGNNSAVLRYGYGLAEFRLKQIG